MRFPAALLLLTGLAHGAAAQETIVLAPDTDREVSAVVFGPEDAAEAVLIVHDWYGVSLSLIAEVKRQGLAGRRAMVVDLYDGDVADNDADAQAYLEALDGDKAQIAIRTALDTLGASDRPVALIGYSMGGAIALRALADNADLVRAAVLVYGGSYDVVADDQLADAPPVLAIAGSEDDWAFTSLLSLQERMKALGNPVESYVYPGAGHGYAQSLFANGDNFDPTAIAATRDVVDSFLERQH